MIIFPLYKLNDENTNGIYGIEYKQIEYFKALQGRYFGNLIAHTTGGSDFSLLHYLIDDSESVMNSLLRAFIMEISMMNREDAQVHITPGEMQMEFNDYIVTTRRGKRIPSLMVQVNTDGPVTPDGLHDRVDYIDFGKVSDCLIKESDYGFEIIVKIRGTAHKLCSGLKSKDYAEDLLDQLTLIMKHPQGARIISNLGIRSIIDDIQTWEDNEEPIMRNRKLRREDQL
jgi:hypothetical protein